MTGPSDPPVAPPPRRRAADIAASYRATILEDYLWSNRDRFTEAALATAAEGAGYGSDEIAAAAGAVARRRADEAAARPIKARARRSVLLAYGITWLVFAFLFLRPEADSVGYYRGVGPFALGILAVVLFLTLLLALAWIATQRPSADRAESALSIMLSVPFVLLVIVAGLCVTTTQSLIFGAG
jgi:hypothetical protein